jgi:hypothetical protein
LTVGIPLRRKEKSLTNNGLDIDEKLPDIVDQSQYDDPFFGIPDLSFGPVDNISTPSHSTRSSKPTPEAEKQEKGDESDIWLMPEEIPVKVANYQSWDTFDHNNFEEGHTPYITEAGASIFDTAVAAEDDYLRIGTTDYIVVDTNVYTSSVLALGLGRSSVLFSWEDEKQCFGPAHPKARISGYTGEMLDDLLAIFYECGNITRSLQTFVDKTYAKNTSPSYTQ